MGIQQGYLIAFQLGIRYGEGQRIACFQRCILLGNDLNGQAFLKSGAADGGIRRNFVAVFVQYLHRCLSGSRCGNGDFGCAFVKSDVLCSACFQIGCLHGANSIVFAVRFRNAYAVYGRCCYGIGGERFDHGVTGGEAILGLSKRINGQIVPNALAVESNKALSRFNFGNIRPTIIGSIRANLNRIIITV